MTCFSRVKVTTSSAAVSKALAKGRAAALDQRDGCVCGPRTRVCAPARVGACVCSHWMCVHTLARSLRYEARGIETACAGCCCAAWNELIQRENFNFDRRTSHGRVDYIVAFGTGRRFVSSPDMFLAFRTTLCVVMLAVLVWSFSKSAVDDEAQFWFIYLTHWTLLIEVVYLCCALFTTATLRPKVLDRLAGSLPPTPGFSDGMPLHVKITWILQSVVLPASFLVSNAQTPA